MLRERGRIIQELLGRPEIAEKLDVREIIDQVVEAKLESAKMKFDQEMNHIKSQLVQKCQQVVYLESQLHQT